MELTTELLRQHPALVLFWRVAVLASVVFLLTLGVIAIARPAVAMRFLGGLASSPLTNSIEAALRLVVGLGFMGAAPDMRLSSVFFWFGAILAATAVPMALLHKAHKRQAGWAIPFVRRILPVYGLLSLALGGFCAWALI